MKKFFLASAVLVLLSVCNISRPKDLLREEESNPTIALMRLEIYVSDEQGRKLTLRPSFQPNIDNYYVDISKSIEKVSVIAESNYFDFSINGGPQKINRVFGTETGITITVYESDEWDAARKNYTINFIRTD